jgi:hypothetical protein
VETECNTKSKNGKEKEKRDENSKLSSQAKKSGRARP